MVVGYKNENKGEKGTSSDNFDPKSVEKTSELELNISKIAQNALDEAIR
jgi:hypothetical protein